MNSQSETSEVAEVVRFQNHLNKNFTQILNQRVNDYFKSKKIGRNANAEMIIKTIVMFAVYFTPYFLILFVIQNVWIAMGLYLIMGFANAGIGFSVMHDANHGAYSKNKWVNQILGYSINILGANATNWKIQHNVFHHSYTNIEGHDEDIRPRFILRFSPHSKKMNLQKYQHIYAWILYGFITISWLLVKDFAQLANYHKRGVLEKHVTPWRAWTWLLFSKATYYTYMIVIPILITPFAWWQILLGIFIMQYVAGWTLGVVFQLAHVMEATEFPQPNEKGSIEENWTVHQLKTTCNFAPESKPLTWYVGGLNHQVEHHLFPHICHVHYASLSKIVRKTAKEFGMPYYSYPTLFGALKEHGRMLYQLGH